MKKRVKVYKAENGQGAYMSNLAKFMQKAQMGGQPTMEQMSYPGDQQGQEGQQMDQDQVINMIAMDITNGRPKEETMAKLTNIVGLDFQTADQFFEGVRTQINTRKETVEEESVDEEGTPPDPSGNPQTVEKQTEEEDEEEEGPSNNDIAYQDALNDDSDEAVMEGDVEGMFQMGGDVSSDFGDEYSVTLPDVSAYLPSDMYNFWDPQNPAAQVAWSDQMYANPTQQEVDSSYTEMPEQPEMAKFGGYKKEKKTYVNAILKANRKQMGGDAVSEESTADSTGQNYRTAKLKGFVGTLKNNATESLLREQAEQQFDQMMQEGGSESIYQGQDFENPMHHLEALSNATGNIFNEDMNQVTMAQRGGWLQRLRGQNQQVPNMGFMQRRGFMNPMMPIESIDVRRSGRLFGKPKEYTVTFGPPTLPGGANGVYPGAFYGYGAGYPAPAPQKKTVTTAGTIINEAAKTTNQEASKEVAKNTPQSEATQKSAEGTKQTEGTTTTNTGGGGGNATTTTNQTQQPVVTKIVPKPIKRDSWGRPEGDQWFGYDPKQKRYTEGPKFQSLVNTGPNVTPGLSQVQRNIATTVVPKSREEAVATNKQYFQNQRANAFQPAGMLVDVNANPIGRITEEDKKQAQQDVEIKKEVAKVKKGDTSGLSDAQIKALRLNYSRPGEAAKLKKSNPALYKTLFAQEVGGNVDFDQLQNMEYLQRFIYGGNEDPSLAYINQADMDYTNSKDVTDPYFQYGGVNQVTGIRNNQGQQMQGYVRPDGSYIKDITVNKVGMFGRPKQYSVTYGQPGDPRTPEIKLNTPGQDKTAETKQEPTPQASTTNSGTRTNTEGLDFKAARAIRKGERQTERQLARGERQFGTAEEAGLAYERANPMQPMPIRNVGRIEANPLQQMPIRSAGRVDMPQRNFVSQNPYELERQRNMELLKNYLNPSSYSPELNTDELLNTNQLQDFRDMLQNPSGLPMYYQDGGSFIGANPVVYTDNPALVGQSNVDMITLNPGIQGAQGQVNWADLNNNTGFNLNQPKQYTQDPNQINSDQAKRAYSGDVTVDIKNSLSNDQLQAGMNLANAGIRGITGMKNKMDDARIAQGFYDNFTSDNIYASDPSKEVGDYSEAGLYQPSAQGQVWGSRSKQYGGDISFGEDPDYVEGDEVYMTDDEIRQYMANGGQVEYL